MYMANRNKRIRLNLTGIGEILTESAEKRLEQAEENILEPTCDNGKTLSWYEDMGIKPPKDLQDKIKEFEQGVKLEDDDFEEITSEVIVYEDQIKLIVEDSLTKTTTIFLKDGLTVRVLESALEIDSYLDYIQMSWIEKKISVLLSFFRQKNKIEGNE